MKFSCEKDILLSAINTASRCTASKSPIASLEGLLIECGTNVCITGYDLKKGIYTKIDADIAEPGSIVLSARLFGDIVRSFPDGIVTVSCDKDNLTLITCENSEFSIVGISSEDYPELPAVDEQNAVSIPQKTMKEMIEQTIFAVSDNESRAIYTGSLFEIEDSNLTVVAVDGYRLALRREKLETNAPDCSFIVPGAALADLIRICSDSEESVGIVLGSKHISFTIENTVLVSRRLEGDFLNYKKSIPQNFSVNLTVDRSAMIKVTERVSLIIDDRTKNPLRCTVGDNEIKFLCVTARGKAEDVCPISGTGNGLEIGFNNRYLLDALKAAPADTLKVCMNTGSSPCVIVPENSDGSFVYMVLPVRLKSEA